MVNIPKISVIVPVYNVEHYLRCCLDSVLFQTFQDWEAILVDDGSTDSSGAICDEYATRDSRFRVLHKKNGGLSSARNCGIEKASGDWIVFLDSDDVWATNQCLRLLYDYAISLNLDILRFEYQAVNDKLVPIEPRVYDKADIENRVVDNYSIVKYGINGEWFAVLFLMRKSVIDGVSFNEQTRFQEDIDFYCRLFAQREMRCGYVNKKLYLYRKHSSSITTTPKIGNLKGSFDLCDVFYRESGKCIDKRLVDLYMWYSVMMYYWTLQTLASPIYYKDKRNIVTQLQLEELQRRTKLRAKNVSIKWKYRPFLYFRLQIAIPLLYIKDRIIEML